MVLGGGTIGTKAFATEVREACPNCMCSPPASKWSTDRGEELTGNTSMVTGAVVVDERVHAVMGGLVQGAGLEGSPSARSVPQW